MNLSPKHLIKLLELHGFRYKRTKGSHQLYYNSITNKTAIVPVHGGRDIKKALFYQYLNKPVLIKMKSNNQ